jgi:hypothetical protein
MCLGQLGNSCFPRAPHQTTACHFAASTEIVARLGMAHTLVGISHECDFPGSVMHVSRMPLGNKLQKQAQSVQQAQYQASGTPLSTFLLFEHLR